MGIGELFILAFLLLLALVPTILVLAACIIAGRDDRSMEQPE